MNDLRQMDLWTLDYDRLTPEAREAVRWEAIRRANAARDAMIDECLRDIAAGLRRLAAAAIRLPAAARRAIAALCERRRLRARALHEIAVLRGLDDCELRDIGITRVDIAALAHSAPHRRDGR